ncbi:hypothetical protein HN011_004312 [Eciton burchellii]|nr:hypothetical protein HN011_004312 [Eciton burchellii]
MQTVLEPKRYHQVLQPGALSKVTGTYDDYKKEIFFQDNHIFKKLYYENLKKWSPVPGKLTNAVKEMKRLQIDILGISETR